MIVFYLFYIFILATPYLDLLYYKNIEHNFKYIQNNKIIDIRILDSNKIIDE